MVRRIMLLDVRLLDFFHELRQALAHVFLLSDFQSLHVLCRGDKIGDKRRGRREGGWEMGEDGTGRDGEDRTSSALLTVNVINFVGFISNIHQLHNVRGKRMECGRHGAEASDRSDQRQKGQRERGSSSSREC